MKNLNIKSFLCGVLACLMVIGLCGTVMAAATGTTISVSYGTKVLFNGQSFQPKDSAGRNVQLITYNGTVYAPIRAICEKAGLKVDYDAATKTASIMTADYVPPVTLPEITGDSVTIHGITVTGNLGFLRLPVWLDIRDDFFTTMAESGVTAMQAATASGAEYGFDVPVYCLSYVDNGKLVTLVLEPEAGNFIEEIIK